MSGLENGDDSRPRNEQGYYAILFLEEAYWRHLKVDLKVVMRRKYEKSL